MIRLVSCFMYPREWYQRQ